MKLATTRILKEFLKFKAGKSLDIKFPIQLLDSNGNIIYYEDYTGFWIKRELDSGGNPIYSENSQGIINDNRPKTKELSIKEIEELLGYKIEVVK